MADESWKNDIAYAMTPFKLFTWPVGVWPLQDYNLFSLLRSVLGTCCAGFMVTISSLEMFLGCTDAEQSVDCIMCICCGICGVVKTIWFRIYANNLIDNYNSAVHDYLTIKNMEERATMRKHAFIGRIIFCPLMCFSYVICIMYTLMPFLIYGEENQNITNEDIVLEYSIIPLKCVAERFHASINTPKYLAITQGFALLMTTNANAGNDALFLHITLHVCGQVKILRTNFNNFDVTCPQVYDRFNVLIHRHSYLIRMARELADTISFVLLVELFMISILLCIMGFQLLVALRDGDTGMLTQSLMLQSVFFTKLTMYSFIGNYLKSQMEDVAISIYQNAWYKLPVKIEKNLVFIFMQTESPVAFQAGNFITVNLSTLVNIVKTSFSYLTVLRIMLET